MKTSTGGASLQRQDDLSMYVFVIATLDTKGTEAALVRGLLVTQGVPTWLVDAGCLGEPQVPADVTREQVFEAAGTSLAAMQAQGDRGEAVARAAQGAARLVQRFHGEGQLAGVLALGGGAGTTIGTAAMHVLPVGVPKLMLSTMASGQVRSYVAGRDIMMLYSVVDILGINRVSRLVLFNAAHAMAGMVQAAPCRPAGGERPIVAASMFGVTTPCVERAREVLEAAGYEVLVFHATGIGGETMEGLIRDGFVAGVLDLTTTELADELVGGVLSAGPRRLTAAGERGVPQVVSVGATDMVNFYEPKSVPAQFQQRKLHRHNPHVTLMRTNAEENAQIGADIGRKLSRAAGPRAILLPRQGVSALDRCGQPFDDPQAREALFRAIRAEAAGVEIVELDCHLNDRLFAETAAEKLLEMMRSQQSRSNS
jgi:uncharacterized protein (UPF0261 family)